MKLKRALRRARSLAVSIRRLKEHNRMRYLDPSTGLPSGRYQPRDEHAHYYAKVASFDCGCAKRKHGAPKVSCGICFLGSRDRIYKWRAERRELLREYLEDEAD